MTTIPDLDTIKLEAGKHKSPDDGMCLLELAAYLSPTSEFTDHPKCVSPVLGSFGRSWNDALGDETRQLLKPYAPKLLNTATGKRDDEIRAWMLTDWLARECAPAFLRLAGLTAQAELLESLAPLTSAAKARKAQPVLDGVRKEAAAARAAAGAAARAAAWDAAGAAARAAAGAAAGAAAWDAAGAAAWDAAGAAAGAAARAAAGAAAGAAAAARDAAGAAAWDAAGAAAWDAAGAAAGAAARDAAGAAAGAAARDAAGAAAGAAAREALAPTVKELQASALRLLDRMIDVSAKAAA